VRGAGSGVPCWRPRTPSIGGLRTGPWGTTTLPPEGLRRATAEDARRRPTQIAAAGACLSAFLYCPAGWLDPGRPGGSIPAGASEGARQPSGLRRTNDPCKPRAPPRERSRSPDFPLTGPWPVIILPRSIGSLGRDVRDIRDRTWGAHRHDGMTAVAIGGAQIEARKGLFCWRNQAHDEIGVRWRDEERA
jgi:hypothetical protein